MDQLINHFSLEDWDYGDPGPYISDAVYVSAPSSLAARKGAAFDRQGWAMCKLAAAQCIPDGKIVSSHYLNATLYRYIWHIFRAQANPPSNAVTPDNSYDTAFGATRIDVEETVAGTNTTLYTYTIDPALSLSTWYKFRTTFWQYLDPSLTKLLRVQVDQYKAAEWVKLFHYDLSANRWKDSAVNKVGVMVLHSGSEILNAIDDAEIWKKT